MPTPTVNNVDESVKYAKQAMYLSIAVAVVLIICFIYFAQERRKFDDASDRSTADSDPSDTSDPPSTSVQEILKNGYLLTVSYLSIALMVVLAVFMTMFAKSSSEDGFNNVITVILCLPIVLLAYFAVRIFFGTWDLRPETAKKHPSFTYETAKDIEGYLICGAFISLALAGVSRYMYVNTPRGKGTVGGFINHSSLDFLRSAATTTTNKTD